jgi:hypothetical protein
VNETLGSTGMGPEEPVVSSRSGHRNRNVFMLGGLALVLVAGVILAGVFPTGDRAGTTATDPSASPTPSATPSATATDDPTDDLTKDSSASSSVAATDDRTEEPVEVTTCAEGGACDVGDIGPGGGLVFYNAGSRQDWGQYIEMAPKQWGGESDPIVNWCNISSKNVPGAAGTAVGTGSANTTAIDVVCASGAGQSAADYSVNGQSDWFLPSKLELNAMYTYSQVDGFNTGTYGFESTKYWSSSQYWPLLTWTQNLDNGVQTSDSKSVTLRARPVRAF